jgi:hypothetical protein
LGYHSVESLARWKVYMEQQKVQDIDSGRTRDSQEKPSSLGSKPKRTSPKKIKAESTLPLQSKTGSTSETQPSGWEKEKEPSAKQSASEMPVPKEPVDRKAEALRRLKVKPEQLETAPQITSLLKDAFGGLPAVMEAMRFSGDEVVTAFLKKYDSIPSGDREVLPWEAIAISARINLNHFAGSAMLSTANYCGNKSKLIIATNHPEITKKRVEYALLAGGEKDRYALDVMAGAMPSAKGPVFIGKASFGASDSGIAKKGEVEEGETVNATAVFGVDDDLDELFPPASAMQDKLVPIRQRLMDK